MAVENKDRRPIDRDAARAIQDRNPLGVRRRGLFVSTSSRSFILSRGHAGSPPWSLLYKLELPTKSLTRSRIIVSTCSLARNRLTNANEVTDAILEQLYLVFSEPLLLAALDLIDQECSKSMPT